MRACVRPCASRWVGGLAGWRVGGLAGWRVAGLLVVGGAGSGGVNVCGACAVRQVAGMLESLEHLFHEGTASPHVDRAVAAATQLAVPASWGGRLGR